MVIGLKFLFFIFLKKFAKISFNLSQLRCCGPQKERKINPIQPLCSGSWHGPSTPGSSYVLLHHVMGGVGEREGAWGYVEGGMGNVSNAIARSALAAGATIKTEAVSVLLFKCGNWSN